MMLVGHLDEWIDRGESFAVCSLPTSIESRTILHFKKNKENRFVNDDGAKFHFSAFEDYLNNKSQAETTKIDHINAVQSAIEEIKFGNLEKVVISRIKHVERNREISLSDIFNSLCIKYPSAFVYCLNDEEYGTWIGATPEVLLQKRQSQYTTMSLAGTLPIAESGVVLWDEKLKHEQQLVTDFISNELRNLGIVDIEIRGPETIQAGPLVHLKSNFQFQTQIETDIIVKALHPTPAICGLPRNKAKDFILQCENHERRLYTGTIGTSQSNGEADVFVNLRCMQIYQDHFELFLGGGITSHSDPESEWLETELKSQVLISVL